MNENNNGDEEMKGAEKDLKKSHDKQVKFDNLYDLLFDSNGLIKVDAGKKKIKIEGDRLDFLDSNG